MKLFHKQKNFKSIKTRQKGKKVRKNAGFLRKNSAKKNVSQKSGKKIGVKKNREKKKRQKTNFKKLKIRRKMRVFKLCEKFRKNLPPKKCSTKPFCVELKKQRVSRETRMRPCLRFGKFRYKNECCCLNKKEIYCD